MKEKGLNGKRVVITGSRKTDEMSSLIEKQGGMPIIRSLQGVSFLDDEKVEPSLIKFVKDGTDFIIFTTSIGLEALLNLARKLDILDQFLHQLHKAKVASRGYKTFAALKKLGVKPIATDDDGTTRGLINSLESLNFSNKKVVVQLHGNNAPKLVEFLERQGAMVMKLLPYQYKAPDQKVVVKLVHELLAKEIDAVCFTTAIQVRNLFQYAREMDYLEQIRQIFNDHTLAACVGKVTLEAIQEEGVSHYISPEIERMGAMIIELSKLYSNR